MKSILDPTFCYTPSTHTDISKTFDRIRREQQNGTRTVAAGQAGKGLFRLRAAWSETRVKTRRNVLDAMALPDVQRLLERISANDQVRYDSDLPCSIRQEAAFVPGRSRTGTLPRR